MIYTNDTSLFCIPYDNWLTICIGHSKTYISTSVSLYLINSLSQLSLSGIDEPFNINTFSPQRTQITFT